MAVDHLTIDPASYTKTDDDQGSAWHHQERHVTFTEDTKMHSGKKEANPWEYTGKLLGNRMGTGFPSIFHSNHEDPYIQALEDVRAVLSSCPSLSDPQMSST